MMSPGTKHRKASTLRSFCAEEDRLLMAGRHRDALVLPVLATEDRRESRGSPPVGSAQRSQLCAPDDLGRILQSKGFAGGVPLNTERTTVKPWVDIARCQEVFVLC